MALMKRIFLFAVINALIITTITISFNLINHFFGLDLNPNSMIGMIAFCAVFGMGGAFISLLMSKFIVKKTMGVEIIDPHTRDQKLRDLVKRIHNYADKAGLPKKPEVGIYNSPEVNAFATGPSKSNSLVAVSTGLLDRLNSDQVDGVLAHEIAHIANGDMVTMTLVQGIINTFVMILARLIANVIVSQMDDRARPMVELGLIIGLQLVLSCLGYMVVSAFSRWREYRADFGSAKLAGKDKMLSALRALNNLQDLVAPEREVATALKISGKKQQSWMQLFASHPPLEDRIKKLEQSAVY